MEKQKTLNGKIAELKEGYILDAATGKPVDGRKPEERIRQEYEEILHDNYGYDYEQMDINVKIQRGTKKSKGETDYADIVLYKTTDKTKRDQNRDILGIVETKRPNREDGRRQLSTYMSAASSEWGIWTNGTEIEYLYKDPKTGEIKRNYIFQIPSKGETFEDLDRFSKKDLKPVKTLKPIFRRILYTLYANTNISRREKLDPYLLLYLLNHLIVRRQIDERTFIQATLSTIGDRLLEVMLPIPKDKKIREKIANDIRCSIQERAKLKENLKKIFNRVEQNLL